MKKILITGGPVHEHLDDVKIITNTFGGGLMARLALDLSFTGDHRDVQVTYLCSRQAKKPEIRTITPHYITVVEHDGFRDYMDKVLKLAPEHDAAILGAAVANLIPHERIRGKFPSHNYKPGDLVPIIFEIAPRVIDKVKEVAPKAHLFGFKLLSGVSHQELIDAAYGVLEESKATTVFANDKTDLETIWAVTKEKGEHQLDRKTGLPAWIWDCINDLYYRTEVCFLSMADAPDRVRVSADRAKAILSAMPLKHVTGHLFGTVAVRCPGEGFVTTRRDKADAMDVVYVSKVDHDARVVETIGGKASLNAPLLDWLFRNHPKVETIVHTHEKEDLIGLPTRAYAPPGTVRDSQRNEEGSFRISGHGRFLLLNGKGDVI